jgi:hypothetical protein
LCMVSCCVLAAETFKRQCVSNRIEWITVILLICVGKYLAAFAL